MPLHQKRHIRTPGTPELVGLLLVAAFCLPLALWFTANIRANWPVAEGSVVQSTVDSEIPDLVEVRYQYQVGEATYQEDWRGYWPDHRSPNALPAGQLAVLTRPGYPLRVYYDPGDATVSSLHVAGESYRIMHLTLAAVMAVLAGYYALRVYPRWRRR
jgi:hypothetical protein